MRNRPFFVMGVSAFLAALLALALPVWALAGLAVAVLVLTAAVWLIPRAKIVRAVWTAAALSALAVGGLFLIKLNMSVSPLLEHDGETAQVTLRIEGPASAEHSYLAVVEEGDLPKGTRLCVWLKTEEDALPLERLRGEVELTGAMEQGERRAYSLANGVYLYAWSAKEELVSADGGEAPFPDSVFLPLRDAIGDVLRDRLHPTAAAIAGSVLLGDRSDLPESVSSAFRDSGVYHLLVVSGLHLSVITGAILGCLKRLRVPRRPRTVIAMLGTVAFMLLCGMTPSVTRAGVMTLLMLGALFLNLRADGLNSLGAAALVMLLVNPFWAADIGMQLSFAATLGLLLLFPVWEERVTASVRPGESLGVWLRPVVSGIGVSLCASLFTLPLTALYFGELSLLFLPANLLCVLPCSAMLVLLVFAVGIGMIPYVGIIAAPLFWLINGLAGWLYGVTSFLSSLPFAAVFHTPPYMIAWLFALAVLLPLGIHWLGKKGAFSVCLPLGAVLLAGVLGSSLLSRGVSTVTAVRGDSTSLLIQSGGETAAVFGGDAKSLLSLERELSDRRVRRLTWLLWINGGSVQSLDFTDFPCEVGTLWLADDPETYVSLPPAHNKSRLPDGVLARLSGGESIARAGGFYRLVLGETSVLISLPGASADALPQDWQDADVLTYETLLPLQTDRLRAKAVVCFCSREDVPRMGAPPARSSSQWMAASGSVSLMTRGRGDITHVWWE